MVFGHIGGFTAGHSLTPVFGVFLCLLVFSLVMRIPISVKHHSSGETTPDHSEEDDGDCSEILRCQNNQNRENKKYTGWRKVTNSITLL